MQEYRDLMASAARYREIAENSDEHRRRQLLAVAYDLEIRARNRKRELDHPPSKTE